MKDVCNCRDLFGLQNSDIFLLGYVYLILFLFFMQVRGRRL
jgi:hypothetical protein